MCLVVDGLGVRAEMLPRRRIEDRDDGDQQALPINLDKFMAMHTSEDNASFAEIMAEGAKRRRLSKPWLFEDKSKVRPWLAAAGTLVAGALHFDHHSTAICRAHVKPAIEWAGHFHVA